MGYTHYFPQKTQVDAKTWSAILEDTRTLLESDDDRIPPLAVEYDERDTKPKIGRSEIRFNGVGDDGHETFYLPRVHRRRGYESPEYRYGFNFTKTARKPYDVAVCAVLLIAHHHAPKFLEIGSDGTPSDLREAEYPNAWPVAKALVADVLGYAPEYPKGIIRSAA